MNHCVRVAVQTSTQAQAKLRIFTKISSHNMTSFLASHAFGLGKPSAFMYNVMCYFWNTTDGNKITYSFTKYMDNVYSFHLELLILDKSRFFFLILVGWARWTLSGWARFCPGWAVAHPCPPLATPLCVPLDDLQGPSVGLLILITVHHRCLNPCENQTDE